MVELRSDFNKNGLELNHRDTLLYNFDYENIFTCFIGLNFLIFHPICK